jgi:hypothetical protein
MFAHIFRLPAIADLAFTNLRPERFNIGTEAHYNILWNSAIDIYDKQGVEAFSNPDYAYAVMEIEILSRVRSRPDVLNTEFFDRLVSRSEKNPGLLMWLFTQVKDSELNIDWGKELLSNFRLEREVSDVVASLVSSAAGKTIINLPDVLTKLSEHQIAIQSQVTERAVSGAPEGWTPKPMKKFKTGITFLDRFLKGGHAKGEAYGVLGAYGSGKTILAVQIAYAGARYEQSLVTLDPEYHPKDWFLFSFEATSDECLQRLWSMACTINHHKIEEFDWSKLTTAANGVDSLEPYERRYFSAFHKQNIILGEKERLEREMPFFNVNFWVHDMTGTGDNPKKGTGYINEIISLIKIEIAELSRRDGWQHEVGGVVIDYAGLCAKRHILDHGIDLNHIRHYVGDFGYKCKTGIAVPFKCPVWIFHQLDTKSNKKSMKTAVHHADAAEAKNFGENMVFCFQLRSKDINTNTLYMDCTKARRGEVGRSPLLLIEGEFFRIVEDTQHTVNTVGEVKPKKGITVESTMPNQESLPDSSFSEEPKDFSSNPDSEFM